jgi:S1-C subfamily serine protease
MTPYDEFPLAPRPPQRPRQQTVLPALVLIFFAVLLTAAGVFVYRHFFMTNRGVDPTAELRPVTPRGELPGAEQDRVQMLAHVKPSVVFITIFTERHSIFSSDAPAVQAGEGSGFVWDKQGHIVTNFHVIQNADAAQVKLNDGQHTATYYARVVGVQPDNDLAVLFIDAKEDELHPIDVGSSHDLQVGQDVMAIGNPFGLGQTVTKGIVSATGREIESVTNTPIKDVIQTDAAVNPGNSGGPLIDSAGRLVGVNTAIYSPSKASAGIGFAIPVDQVNKVVTNLIRTGNKSTTRPRMGVQLATDEFARQQGVKQGALVLGVVPGSPAAKAGLQPTQFDRSRTVQRLGDIIIGVDDQSIKSAKDIFTALADHKPGDTVTITYLRDDEEHQAQVKLQAAS